MLFKELEQTLDAYGDDVEGVEANIEASSIEVIFKNSEALSSVGLFSLSFEYEDKKELELDYIDSKLKVESRKQQFKTFLEG